jgi:IS5 family transposase
VARPRDDRQKDLLQPALEEIINLGHPLIRLAGKIDWGFLDRRFASVCAPGPGQPGLPTRLVAVLLILKHMHNLSDEVLCARWLENPYYQFFCGELSFCHRLPFDPSSLTHWHQRLAEEQLVALIQESPSVAHKTGALATGAISRWKPPRLSLDAPDFPRSSSMTSIRSLGQPNKAARPTSRYCSSVLS